MFSNELVCNLLIYINKNINKEISIDELSSKFFFDKTYIMKRFKKELDLTIFEYINSMRIYNSLSYFNYDNYILSIAFNNGFNSLEYFSETFRKVMGVSPIRYRKYLDHDIRMSDKEINTILDNINRLNNLNSKTIKYLNNRKPTTKMVKNITLN
jgi:AraC-like DNA-binding protein